MEIVIKKREDGQICKIKCYKNQTKINKNIKNIFCQLNALNITKNVLIKEEKSVFTVLYQLTSADVSLNQLK